MDAESPRFTEREYLPKWDARKLRYFLSGNFQETQSLWSMSGEGTCHKSALAIQTQRTVGARGQEGRGKGRATRTRSFEAEDAMPITTTGPERTKSSILLKAAADLAPKLTSITTRNALIEHLAAVAGHTPVQFTIRDAFEMLECAMVGHILGSGQLAEYLLPHIIELHHRLPAQTVRSEVQVSRQQFSTPAPIALFAQSRAAITANDIMLEPSAGTGLLATEAVRLNAALHLNELDPQRRALVSGLFPEAAITGFDGAEIAARWQGRVPSVIVMNPPFSRNADGYEDSFTALRHLHSAHKCLAPGGRLDDWRQYFDPDVEVIADLIDVLPAALTKARSGHSRAKISLPGTMVLANRLSEMIATNDRETAIRQRERPIAGM